MHLVLSVTTWVQYSPSASFNTARSEREDCVEGERESPPQSSECDSGCKYHKGQVAISLTLDGTASAANEDWCALVSLSNRLLRQQRETDYSLSRHKSSLVSLDSSVSWCISTPPETEWTIIIQTNVVCWISSLVPCYIKMLPIVLFFSLFCPFFNLLGKSSNEQFLTATRTLCTTCPLFCTNSIAGARVMESNPNITTRIRFSFTVYISHYLHVIETITSAVSQCLHYIITFVYISKIN